jgi:hypothetical protein
MFMIGSEEATHSPVARTLEASGGPPGVQPLRAVRAEVGDLAPPGSAVKAVKAHLLAEEVDAMLGNRRQPDV